jgi:geranylgeranyl diphosphate synthase type I
MNIDQLKQGINQALLNQVDQFCMALTEIDDQLIPITDSLKDYLSEGKRFRSLFSILGFLGADGKLTPNIYKAAAALEFLQASALIHDDLMDGSDTASWQASYA